jgi:hypothetical protein
MTNNLGLHIIGDSFDPAKLLGPQGQRPLVVSSRLDVLPSCTANNISGSGCAYPIHLSQRRSKYARSRQLADIAHVGILELGLRVVLTAIQLRMQMGARCHARSHSALIERIMRIVSWRSKKQMGWVHTVWVITSVTNEHFWRNGANREFVCEAVRRILDTPTISPHGKEAIAPICSGPFPCPASVRPTAFVNKRPKPIGGIHGVVRCLTLSGTELRCALRNNAWLYLESLATVLTDTFYWHVLPPRNGKAPRPVRFLSREPGGFGATV